MLNNLWSSVSRGGEAFAEQARCIPKDGAYECVFYLTPGGLSPEAKRPLTKYMRSYMRLSGWRMKSMKFTKRYAVFVIATSSAASSRSKNL